MSVVIHKQKFLFSANRSSVTNQHEIRDRLRHGLRDGPKEELGDSVGEQLSEALTRGPQHARQNGDDARGPGDEDGAAVDGRAGQAVQAVQAVQQEVGSTKTTVSRRALMRKLMKMSPARFVMLSKRA